MIIINWNISYMNSIKNKIDYLKQKIENKTFFIILQEVKQNDYEEILGVFSNIASVEYSLNYRKPSKFDTTSRKLGIAIIVSKDIEIINAQVLDRTLLPDRTLMVDTMINNRRVRILGLHSITGCQHGKAKEIQYYSFAEAVDTYKPDIIGIDANEPEYDHYLLDQMKFYDNYNNGNGCKTFFETIYQNNLVDSYLHKYSIENYINGEYLACSYIVNKKKKVRYDFLFINNNLFDDYESVYDYDNAVNAGSDHASIILNVLKCL